MRRYNHRISERKWLKEWGDDSSPKSCPYYGAALIPASAEGIGLDNARVLILADTYRRFDQEKAGPLALGIVPPSSTLTSEIERSARELGCLVTELGETDLQLIVEIRDFAHFSQTTVRHNTLVCGRLFSAPGVELGEVLPDVGADALRIAVLFLGPPSRDLTLKLENIGAAYRFVQRLWRLTQTAGAEEASENDGLDHLETQMVQRMAQGKPHTALAALFGYVNPQVSLSRAALVKVAQLVRPFAPFIACEMLEHLAVLPIKQDHGRNDCNTDS